MTDTPVRTTRNDHVLEVTIDRPKANAISYATSRLMGEIFRDFRDDPDLRVAIVTGAGEKFFSAGWDLKEAAAMEGYEADYGIGGFGGMQELPGLNKPIIAAVNGMAVGGGFEIALSADLIIAAEHASFALPEIRAGTLADAATIKLPKRIPYHTAMDLLLTGRWMDVAEAHRLGLVKQVVPAGELMTKARELASLLASGPPLVYAALKEVVREAEGRGFHETIRMTADGSFATCRTLYESEDQKEGQRAFAEKRDPVWKGR